MIPRLDIIVPIHDQASWADLCIRAVEHHTRVPYRLILVDGASHEPATFMMLRAARERGHTVIGLPENRSFSNAINAGVAAGSAPVLVILNDDALVTEGWDGALLQDLADPGVGLVGARSNVASGAQGDPRVTWDPPFLVFVCVALRRAVWDQVGALDEKRFDGFSSEDLDYSWQILKAGYRLKVSNAFVLHAGSRTLAATVGDADSRAANDRKYNARLIDKWGAEWVRTHTRVMPRILVASFHGVNLTPVRFAGRLVNLKASGCPPFSYYQHVRSPIGMARRAVADYAVDGLVGDGSDTYDVVVNLDDDATFPPETVARLYQALATSTADLVTAVAYQRYTPHAICVYEDTGLETTPAGRNLEGIEHTGIRTVGASGLHVSMYRTEVIRKMRAAGIREYFGGFEPVLGEDISFCKHLRQIGATLVCDTDLVTGHLGAEIDVDESYKRAYTAMIAQTQNGSAHVGVVVAR